MRRFRQRSGVILPIKQERQNISVQLQLARCWQAFSTTSVSVSLTANLGTEHRDKPAIGLLNFWAQSHLKQQQHLKRLAE